MTPAGPGNGGILEPDHSLRPNFSIPPKVLNPTREYGESHDPQTPVIQNHEHPPPHSNGRRYWPSLAILGLIIIALSSIAIIISMASWYKSESNQARLAVNTPLVMRSVAIVEKLEDRWAQHKEVHDLLLRDVALLHDEVRLLRAEISELRRELVRRSRGRTDPEPNTPGSNSSHQEKPER